MSENTKHISISDYNYPLLDEYIAKFPLTERGHSKLLLYRHGEVLKNIFYNLPEYLPKGVLIIFDNMKVIQARMYFRRETGVLIEVLLVEPAQPTNYELIFQANHECVWLYIAGNLKKWREDALKRAFEIKGHKLTLTATMNRSKIQEQAGETNHWIQFEWDNTSISFAEILEAVDRLPILPYLNRATEESDKETYRTVYSKIKSSVAAPTAGLHFTDKVPKALDEHGVDREGPTLRVGAGTFKPVKSQEIEGHSMHTEFVVVHRQTLKKLLRHKCHAVAIGTTSVRTLENLYYTGVRLVLSPEMAEKDLHVNQWKPYGLPHNEEGLVVVNSKVIIAEESIHHLFAYLDKDGLNVLHSSTQIIIAPGCTYKIVKALATNFHQPQPTLLLLVSAFLKGDWCEAYDYALSHDSRLLSYGDSSLLIP